MGDNDTCTLEGVSDCCKQEWTKGQPETRGTQSQVVKAAR